MSETDYGELLGRVGKYLTERAKLIQLNQEIIHGMHIGDERETALTVADIISLKTAIEILTRELEEANTEIANLRADMRVYRTDGDMRAELTATKARLAEAVDIIRKCDRRFFEDGYSVSDWLTRLSMGFLAKQEASQ